MHFTLPDKQKNMINKILFVFTKIVKKILMDITITLHNARTNEKKVKYRVVSLSCLFYTIRYFI